MIIKLKTMKSALQSGFTLVELMIAMAIGLIATVGIVTLFGGTTRSNALQEGLARLQENGRYATLRLESDLRQAGGQYCSNQVGDALANTLTPMWQDRPPQVLAPNLNLPDSGGMQSVDPTTGNRATVAANGAYGLSTRFFMQGYSCTSGTTCTPALWSTGMFPAAGLTAGSRVPNTDILTIRYQRGTGWPISGTGSCASGGTITLAPQAGDAPVNFTSGQNALISDCRSPTILPIASAAGNVLTVGTRVAGSEEPPCEADSDRDVRVFNFSTDFVTVTYNLEFRTNDNPDARPNAGATRLVPVLVRRENGVAQEIVRGVDQLSFRYGVRDNGGNLRFLTAAQVDNRLGGVIACTPKFGDVPPTSATTEPGCLWRSVVRVEAFLLINSGDEIAGLDVPGRAYRFMDTNFNPSDTTALPTGTLARAYARREFIAHATLRNRTP